MSITTSKIMQTSFTLTNLKHVTILYNYYTREITNKIFKNSRVLPHQTHLSKINTLYKPNIKSLWDTY